MAAIVPSRQLTRRRRPGTLRTALEVAAACLCVWLLALDVYGTIYRADLRNRFSPRLSYAQALGVISKAWHQDGPAPRFFVTATRTYHAAIAFASPDGLARVAWRDDWILALAAYLDPLIHGLGLKNDGRLFGQFESYRYERALGRGFGLCSQHALGLADLLYRKFGSDIHMVGLDGHVVTQVDLPDHRQMILDPSTGVVFPFGLTYAESHLADVSEVYSKIGYADLAKTYDRAGNFIDPRRGAEPYSPKQFWKQAAVRSFERISDVMKWIIPLAGLLIVGVVRFSAARRQQRQYIPVT